MNFGEDAGFVVSVITARDGSERVGGVAFEDGTYHHLDAGHDRDRLGGRRPVPRDHADRGDVGDRTYEITGSVLSMIPLRNRRTTPEGEQLVTRISEGMTEWKWDGRSGYGLSEYLDQIVDGVPGRRDFCFPLTISAGRAPTATTGDPAGPTTPSVRAL